MICMKADYLGNYGVFEWIVATLSIDSFKLFIRFTKAIIEKLVFDMDYANTRTEKDPNPRKEQ